MIHTIFGVGALLAQIISVILIISFFSKKDLKIKSFTKCNTLLLSFITSFLATVGSLIYSEIIGFPPCTLCWYQRILMYPTVILTLVAFTKDFSKEIFYYIRALSYPGAAIALYHSIIKMTGISPFPCSAFSVSGADCVKQLVLEFGYINIPMMSFSFFILLIILSYYGTKK